MNIRLVLTNITRLQFNLSQVRQRTFVYSEYIRLCFELFQHYLHVGFEQCHGIDNHRLVGLFICVYNKLENVTLVMLRQIGFKDAANHSLLLWADQHNEGM